MLDFKKITRVVCCNFIVVAALIGCESDEKLPSVNRFEIAKDVCNFDRAIPYSITAVQQINGSVVYGSVLNQGVYSALPTVWSAIYATKKDVVTTSSYGAGFCCHFSSMSLVSCGFQQSCRSKENHDISALIGIGRAADARTAASLAKFNCEQIVRQYKESNKIFSYSDFECQPLALQQCY